MATRKHRLELTVFICRAQPPHLGHLHIVRNAARISDHVLVILGSSTSSVNLRNPFTAEQRTTMMEIMLEDAGLENRVTIVSAEDVLYNDVLWTAHIQSVVHRSGRATSDRNVALIGYGKDETSYYLKKFPRWQSLNVGPFKNPSTGEDVSATYLRENFIFPDPTTRLHGLRDMEPLVPLGVISWLEANLETIQCQHRRERVVDIVREEAKIAKNRLVLARRGIEGLEDTKYPVTFVTTDAVVIQSGHVLMIERKDNPGRGLLALPGGFAEGQKLMTETLRELTEETGLKVPEKVLRGSYRGHRAFDDPMRSIRGRIITHAYLFELEDGHEPPRIRAGSDAKRALWLKLGCIYPTSVYEDHYHIIQRMVSRLEN